MNILVIFLISLMTTNVAFAGSTGLVDIETMRNLKMNMDAFYLNTSEIQSRLEPITDDDWAFITVKLGDMSRQVLDMEVKDKKKIYHEYTYELYEMMRSLKKASLKKDADEFKNKFAAMTDTCFKCHSTHRRPDVRVKNKTMGIIEKERGQQFAGPLGLIY